MSKSKNSRKQIDWLNHSLEFIVVVIGILLAFQLNKCSSDGDKRETISAHMIQLKEETEFNKKSIESAIEFAEGNLRKMDTLFIELRNRNNLPKINQLSLKLLDLGGVYFRKNAYKGLVESGDIRFMKSLDQKKKIIDLYEYYKWVEAFDEISMNLYTSDFYPYVRDNFDVINGSTQSEEIYFSKKYKNILGAYYHTSKNRLSKYNECLIEIDGYLKL